MANAGEEHRFSWKLAALHVGIPLLLAALASGTAAVTLGIEHPGRMGEETGRLMLPGLLLAGFTSWLIQTRRWAYAAVFGTLAALAVAGAVAMPIVRHSLPHRIALTDAERAPLQVVDIGGAPHLQHPRLRFSLAQPPGLEHRVEAEVAIRGVLRADPSRRIHAYAAEQIEDAMLVVVLEKWDAVEREQVARIVDDLARAGDARADVAGARQRRVVWEPSFRGAEAHYVIGDGDHLRVGAWVDSFGSADGEVIVAVVGFSRGRDVFAGVIPSFRYR